MKFKEFKNIQVAALENSVEYFTNSKKQERELWVAREFLRRYVPEVELAEIRPVKADPPDVRFRDINFEIKEILDEGYRRHAQYKRELQVARSAMKYADFVKDVDVNKRVPLDGFIQKVETHVTSYRKDHSKEFMASIDALYYVNLRGILARKICAPLVPPSGLRDSGFRSISLLFNDGTLVIAATSVAPALIRDNCGHLYRS